MLVESVRPIDICIDAQRIGRVHKAEKVLVAGPCALQVEGSVELVLAAERLVQAQLHHVLMAAAEHGRLVVVARRAGNIRHGVER